MDEVQRLAHGLWRPVAALATEDDRRAALLSLAPDDAWLSGLTAGRIRGLWLPQVGAAEPVEVIVGGASTTPKTRAHSRRPELLVRRRRLRPEDVEFVNGLPVTSGARTWVDLAPRLSVEDLVAAGDSVLRTGVTVAALREAVVFAEGQRGVINARRALDLLDRRSRSRMESLLRVGLVLRDLPSPEVNVPIFDDLGQWLAEPDLSYDDTKIALEYQGAEHAEVNRMRRDISRGIDLGERGRWQVVAVGPRQVFGQMDTVAELVRRLRGEQLADRSATRRVVR